MQVYWLFCLVLNVSFVLNLIRRGTKRAILGGSYYEDDLLSLVKIGYHDLEEWIEAMVFEHKEARRARIMDYEMSRKKRRLNRLRQDAKRRRDIWKGLVRKKAPLFPVILMVASFLTFMGTIIIGCFYDCAEKIVYVVLISFLACALFSVYNMNRYFEAGDFQSDRAFVESQRLRRLRERAKKEQEEERKKELEQRSAESDNLTVDAELKEVKRSRKNKKRRK